MSARLGLQILYSLLKPEDAKVHPTQHIPDWIQSNRFGFLTVESPGEIEQDLQNLGIRVYRQKTAESPHTVLLEIIEEILDQQRSST